MTIHCRTLSVSLIGMIIAISVSLSPLHSAAYAQAPGGISPNDIKVVPYAYKGQNYEIRLYKGELMMVSKDNLLLVMYSRGTAHPIGQDANAVAAAEGDPGTGGSSGRLGDPDGDWRGDGTGSTGRDGGA